MAYFPNTVRRFFRSEFGGTVVHYAVMLELLAIVCLAAVGSIQH
jgi:Flp pilus assembly pilin Flp